MKQRGFTLVELLSVIGIMLILISISLLGINGYTKIKKEIGIQTSFYEMEDKILLAKEECKNRKTKGEIHLKTEDKETSIILQCDDGLYKEYLLGNGIMLINPYDETYENIIRTINVSDKGHLSAGTIDIIYLSGGYYKLKIRVGVDLV